MTRMRTTREKALHQVKRGRRKVTARDFNQNIRDGYQTLANVRAMLGFPPEQPDPEGRMRPCVPTPWGWKQV